MKIIIQRIYDHRPPEGYRVLVDRIWPRGISKEVAHLHDWWKDIAPTPQLRKWFNHDDKKWAEFRKKYLHELHLNKDLITGLFKKAAKHAGPLVLLYGAKNNEHNQAVVLQEFLKAL